MYHNVFVCEIMHKIQIEKEKRRIGKAASFPKTASLPRHSTLPHTAKQFTEAILSVSFVSGGTFFLSPYFFFVRICEMPSLDHSRVNVAGLSVAKVLYDLVNETIAPGSGVSPAHFWSSLNDLVVEMGPTNAYLLAKRDAIQKLIDGYHLKNRGTAIDMYDYQAFLKEIGYLTAAASATPFKIDTQNVDPEIALVSGPQLVCPSDNSRFLLNACNARWGSLLDAGYGTDVIPETPGAEKTTGYNPGRGAKVFEFAEGLLDEIFPLKSGSFADATAYAVANGGFVVTLKNGQTTSLQTPEKFVGYTHAGGKLRSVLLKNNNLHMQMMIDPTSRIGKTHRAGLEDIMMEAALSAICDLEDSVATVDAFDKCKSYSNWHGLMNGSLGAKFMKGGEELTRRMEEDKVFSSPDGKQFTLKGRALMLVRNVGIHMFTNAVTKNGREIPEGFLDCMVTSLAASKDLKQSSIFRNSTQGSVYIVKPKMHGPEEVAFTSALFSKVEDILGMPKYTLKMGIMDEERRTTVNLAECIRAAKDRVVFINTGFLDRTGDEIHTSMEAGPMLPKSEIGGSRWKLAYEDWNVDVGIECGLLGKAQIGKGMWAAPDDMAEMLKQKIGHPKAGANCAWTPSPTAATLHAIHYHRVFVQDVQAKLATRAKASLQDILTPPLLNRTLKAEEIQKDLDNNVQGILGYVVRWIDQGVGCSKVPDLENVGLMEDRATLRISSQHIANWLHWDIVSESQIMDTFQRVSAIVDEQNKGDGKYMKMFGRFDDSIAFKGALALVFEGIKQPNGYTEYVLTDYRRQAKSAFDFGFQKAKL
jgi:malate synthase